MQERIIKKYPFKLLDFYVKADADIFFGRDEEIKDLFELVSNNSMVLVYGASGTGKTSLIQCGLATKFKSYDWLPLLIRRGSNITESLMAKLDEYSMPDEFIKQDHTDGATPLTALTRKLKGVYLNHFKPVYLVFDQFEELYTLGSKQEEAEFIQAIQELSASPYPVKIIFSIREEYLGHLYGFEQAIPRLLRKKYRVEAMNFDMVQRVIGGINQCKTSNVRVDENQLAEISRGIFDKIKGKEETITIQLPYLQLFLDKLYLKATNNDESREAEATINLDLVNSVGTIGDVLSNFLEERVQKITTSLQAMDATLTQLTTWKILSPFATLEGTKEPIKKSDLSKRLPGIQQNILDQSVAGFEQSRILRNTGIDVYELSHDSLAARIAEKRSVELKTALELQRLIKTQAEASDEMRTLFNEKQLAYYDHFAALISLTDKQNAFIAESREAVKKAANKVFRDRVKRALIATFVISAIAFYVAGLGTSKLVQYFDNSHPDTPKNSVVIFPKKQVDKGSSSNNEKDTIKVPVIDSAQMQLYSDTIVQLRARIDIMDRELKDLRDSIRNMQDGTIIVKQDAENKFNDLVAERDRLKNQYEAALAEIKRLNLLVKNLNDSLDYYRRKLAEKYYGKPIAAAYYRNNIWTITDSNYAVLRDVQTGKVKQSSPLNGNYPRYDLAVSASGDVVAHNYYDGNYAGGKAWLLQDDIRPVSVDSPKVGRWESSSIDMTDRILFTNYFDSSEAGVSKLFCYENRVMQVSAKGSLVPVVNRLSHTVKNIAFSPNAKWIATIGLDRKKVNLLNMQGKMVQTLCNNTKEEATSIQFFRNGKALVVASRNKFHVYSGFESNGLDSVTIFLKGIERVKLSPDNKTIVVVSSSGLLSMYQWRAPASVQLVSQLNISGSPVLAAEFSTRGDELLVTDKLGVWKLPALARDASSAVRLAFF